jgi:hypothetical protein
MAWNVAISQGFFAILRAKSLGICPYGLGVESVAYCSVARLAQG